MEWIKRNKKNILLSIILIVGFITRLIAIDKYPRWTKCR